MYFSMIDFDKCAINTVKAQHNCKNDLDVSFFCGSKGLVYAAFQKLIC